MKMTLKLFTERMTAFDGEGDVHSGGGNLAGDDNRDQTDNGKKEGSEKEDEDMERMRVFRH